MLLAVTHDGDEHAAPLLAALRGRRVAVAVLDLASYPRAGIVALSPGREPGWLASSGGERIHLAAVRSVWWRRPRAFEPSPGTLEAHRPFAVAQATEAVLGALVTLRGQARWVNDAWAGELANYKVNQLTAAARHGLRIPESVVTSDPGTAREFLARRGDVGAVYKFLRGTPQDWLTRRITERELARLDQLPLAPVIFQERVPGVDVRVTAIGEQLFAAEIDARSTRSPDDFRDAYADCKVAPCTLPAEVAAGIRGLMRELGLLYGAVDLRRRDDGAWFFLEVNPAGQWLFVEERAGLPITEALASLLAAPAP